MSRVALDWQHSRTGIPEYRLTRDGVEVGRIRFEAYGAYWATPTEGDRRPVLFVDRGQAATWLAKTD